MGIRTRLTGFLVICIVLIGLNVVATITGLYKPDTGQENVLNMYR